MPLEDLEALGYTVERGAGVDGADLVYGPQDVEPFAHVWLVTPENEQAVIDEANNHIALMTKLRNVQQLFADNYANWPTMTAQQKDNANRNAQRAMSNVIRNIARDLSSGGD